jgi:hypothetical protein
MSVVPDVVFFNRRDSSLKGHLTGDRLLQLFEETGPEFSEEELLHLTNCQECIAALAAFDQPYLRDLAP